MTIRELADTETWARDALRTRYPGALGEEHYRHLFRNGLDQAALTDGTRLCVARFWEPTLRESTPAWPFEFGPGHPAVQVTDFVFPAADGTARTLLHDTLAELVRRNPSAALVPAFGRLTRPLARLYKRQFVPGATITYIGPQPEDPALEDFILSHLTTAAMIADTV